MKGQGKLIFIFLILFIFVFSTLSFSDESYYKKAMDYFWKGAYKKAIPFFKKAIDREENLCDAYFYLGLSYINLKKYKSAYNISSKLIELCNEKIKENPKDFKAHYYLGYIYELRSFVPGIDEYEKAISEFLIAYELFPKNVTVMEHIAFCYIQKGEYGNAIEYLEKAEELLSHDPWIIYHKGYCYMKQGNKQLAKTYFQQILDMGKENNRFYKLAKEMMGKIK